MCKMIIIGFIKNRTYLKEEEGGSNSGGSKDINAKFYIQTKLCSSYVIVPVIPNAWDNSRS